LTTLITDPKGTTPPCELSLPEQAVLHAVQEAGFLFFLEAAEESLDHKRDKD
jgi:hypothetical protein